MGEGRGASVEFPNTHIKTDQQENGGHTTKKIQEFLKLVGWHILGVDGDVHLFLWLLRSPRPLLSLLAGMMRSLTLLMCFMAVTSLPVTSLPVTIVYVGVRMLICARGSFACLLSIE